VTAAQSNSQDAASLPAPLVEPRAVTVPRDEVERRLAAFRETLRADGIDVAVVVQNADLYYLTGTVQQSHLVVPADGDAVLLTRRSVVRARAESPLDVEELPTVRRLSELVAEACGGEPEVVGMELDVLPVAQFRRYESLLARSRFVDVGAALVRQRAVKSPWEIERVRTAAALADEVFARIPALLRVGLTEVAFAGRVEAEARALGHQGVIRMRAFNGEMFYGQLLTGVSGAVPSFLDTPLAGLGLSPAVAQGVSFREIGRGEPIVFDFVPVVDGYTADFTRMFSIGELPGRLTSAYECARRAQAAAAACARRGALCREVYEAALAVACDEGLDEHFMGHGPAQVRFVGHGVGLELDELPVLSPNDLALEPGMVFALEPKFVFPGLGAIGIENTWTVGAAGAERLTLAPEEIVVV
jgi:Xaa-Pro aminopeptidase